MSLQAAKSAAQAVETFARHRFVFHRWISGAFTKLLKNNESGLKTFQAPSQQEARAIRAYARRTLGSSNFAPGMIFYTAIRGEFREGWLTEDYFGLRLLPKLNPSYRNVSDIKSITNKILRTRHIPDIGYLINGKLFDTHWNAVEWRNMDGLLFDGRDEVVYKSDGSWKGAGVRFIRKQETSASSLRQLENGVFQLPVQQSQWLTDFYPHAVNTIRITTSFARNQGVRFRSSYLRLGRKGERVIGSKQVSTPIADPNGTIAPFAFDDEWRYVDRHPDTGRAFANVRIPHFEDAVALCLDLHSRIPHFGLIGWDTTIDARGEVVILEWNADHPAITLPEATVGPSYADLIESYR